MINGLTYDADGSIAPSAFPTPSAVSTPLTENVEYVLLQTDIPPGTLRCKDDHPTPSKTELIGDRHARHTNAGNVKSLLPLCQTATSTRKRHARIRIYQDYPAGMLILDARRRPRLRIIENPMREIGAGSTPNAARSKERRRRSDSRIILDHDLR